VNERKLKIFVNGVFEKSKIVHHGFHDVLFA
jgi:hypothetical protein